MLNPWLGAKEDGSLPRPRKTGFWFALAALLLRPLLMLLTKRDWRGTEHIPREGGFIVAANHISYFDPIALGHFLYDNGRLPRYLAKSGLFTIPVLGSILRSMGQIPTYRGTKDAARSLRDAVAAVRRGECVIILPDGTITRDPDLWPMVGKTGVARVALTTGAPVIPIAQWGPQEVLSPYSKKLELLPRKTMRIKAGPPVDLSEFAGQELTGPVLRAATDKIVAAIVEQLEELRGEKAPPERYDMRKTGVPETGNPAKRQRGRR
ncbi:1-acyl-sn-glycerol-3-phosphate acyltransferase [Carbonactinospora thermoautotrophica]|uniref:1-acyl-sn-glycerol-3-phosphate acyltransferase n=1 Tax=Carbonactinospora thermoautotrophica TaxID=1469144 RepID=A0A132MPC5_9ACTN|nr:lysophospholipid acyltransferase family protein [Carbonactinospora thermoautotrophica]KWW99633.1 1-acyl-sn-glycerol-3-phosphate acyltransferase [Carbonactinospora thermoautotrophica]